MAAPWTGPGRAPPHPTRTDGRGPRPGPDRQSDRGEHGDRRNHEQADTDVDAGGLELAFKAGAITGLLVAGLALLGVTLYFIFLTQGKGLAPSDRVVVDYAV